MFDIALFRRLHLRTRSSAVPLLYLTLITSRAASINSAIGRGLRRSEGVGFRGKERSQTDSKYKDSQPSVVRRSYDPAPGRFVSATPLTADSWRKSNTAPSKDPDFKRRPADTRRPSQKPANSNDKPEESWQRRMKIRIGKRVLKEGREKSPNPDGSFGKQRASRPARPTDPGLSKGDNRERTSFSKRERQEYGARVSGGFSAVNTGQGSDQRFDHSSKFAEKRPGSSSTYYKPEETPHLGARPRENVVGDTSYGNQSFSREGSNISRIRVPDRLPISIPYTTPASEFLYGASVVEAALRSKREPRRKLYKFYVYTGDKRENAGKDAELIRLARRSGVEVVHITPDRVQLMDKMSESRPHNGYVLEASPLPRLPLVSLGAVGVRDGESGFEVVVGHQSREEADINGSPTFVKARSALERQPLILLVDSILDPGNLGGIIRTASFLGVTAIAITKNCASITPVVLKASAGASEELTIYMVNKPAGFIADSKSAGWKIYAAVAPSSGRHSKDSPTPLTFTDALQDPLAYDPCILMLGSEGEGLRANLITKADVNLSIRPGSGRYSGVDSLNVSVAAGILCNAFFRRNRGFKKADQEDEEPAASPTSIPEAKEGLF